MTHGFDEGLAHRIEAGADVFLMPSRFEPCGLNQMYSQRYGTPPVARATGGLVDTIADGETGFLFARAESGALLRRCAARSQLRATRPLARDAAPRHAARLQLAGSRSSVCRSLFAPSHRRRRLDRLRPLRLRSRATSEASYSPRIGQRLFHRLKRGRCPIASCCAAASAVSVPTSRQ